MANDFLRTQWYAVNDSVMGGVSVSRMTTDAEQLNFTGNLSLDNNGGFASVRSLLAENLPSNISQVKIKVLGDGRDYKLRFRTNRTFDGIAYSADFKTTKNQWIELTFDEAEFQATYRGYKIAQAPLFDFSDAEQLIFMIADKKSGNFSLQVESIEFD